MWPKFGNSTISMKEVITTSILKGLDQKKQFFWRVLLVVPVCKNQMEKTHRAGGRGAFDETLEIISDLQQFL